MDVPASNLKIGMRLVGKEKVSVVKKIDDESVFIKTENDNGCVLKNDWKVPVFKYEYEDFEYCEPKRDMNGDIVGFHRLHNTFLVERMRALGRIDSLLPMVV